MPYNIYAMQKILHPILYEKEINIKNVVIFTANNGKEAVDSI
jgi:hypothetical protein